MSTPFVRPDVRAFLDFVNNAPSAKMHEVGAVEARAMMLKMRDIADLPVGDLDVIRDFTITGPAGPIAARLFDARAQRAPGPVMVFFHGGGFVIGDLDSHAPLTAEMARILDMPVVAIDYRLAPEAVWPAAPDDCEAAARWIASCPVELGLGVTGLVLAGDSAGGALTIVTAMALRDEPADAPVIAQFPIYPLLAPAEPYPSFREFSDGYFLTREGMVWFTKAYRHDPKHWRGSPAIGRFDGLPPALVLTASLDPLRDEGRAYAAWLIAAGVPTVFREAAGNIHGFMNLRKAIPSSDGDLAGALATLKAIIVESEANRVMAQAARAA